MDVAPKVIKTSEPGELTVTWNDGHVTRYTTAELRRICPCARCIDEFTGRKILDPASVPDDLEHQDVRMVGNYALSVRFGDGHDTGIYPFPLLRKLDPNQG
ncbi:MAG: DUF971 domain-containing protein [Planctomycetota bacterium]